MVPISKFSGSGPWTKLQHNSFLYYYTVAEMHIFCQKSTGKSITCTQVTDNDLVNEVSRWYTKSVDHTLSNWLRRLLLHQHKYCDIQVRLPEHTTHSNTGKNSSVPVILVQTENTHVTVGWSLVRLFLKLIQKVVTWTLQFTQTSSNTQQHTEFMCK